MGMAGKPNTVKTKKVPIFISELSFNYLSTLLKVGGQFGKTEAEIAARMVEDRVAKMMRQRYLKDAMAALEDMAKINEKNPAA